MIFEGLLLIVPMLIVLSATSGSECSSIISKLVESTDKKTYPKIPRTVPEITTANNFLFKIHPS